MAPGVEWLIRPSDGQALSTAQAETQRIMGALYQGRAGLERVHLPVEWMGEVGDLERAAGLGVLIMAILLAQQLVEGWRGMHDWEDGEPLELSDEALTGALAIGPPEGGGPLFRVFMAWVDQPRLPIAADLRRLRLLVKWEHDGGLKACEGCDLASAECARGGTDAGDMCPRIANQPQTEAGIAALEVSRLGGLWARAGMGGQVTGLKHGEALALALQTAAAPLDEAALARCLGAIERGALEAAVERAEREAK